MDYKPILTISIPTYNRSNYLKKCLDHICSQKTEDVLVVVRDNCSTNYDFWEFIEPYENDYGVKAYKNNINIGGDANTARLFEDCETEWLWVIGDDDYIKEGAVALVLETIANNKESIYIKFNAPYSGETIGIEGFCEAMKPRGAFAYSFFTSECINNIRLTRSMMFWHYRYLSTFCPQILRVIKYLTIEETGKCFFCKDAILLEHGDDVTWSRVDIVPYQLLIFDIFHDKKQLFKNNIFKAIISYCLVYIDSSDLPLKDKLYYYSLCFHKYGLFNVLRYNFIQIARIPLRIVLNKKLYDKLKRIVRRG